ncbi:MAG: hypothetical protein H0U19_01525 [Acidobacteria bacterium]|nr:hypothetical protein [Acidobacteriota bacterium]
MIRNVAFRMLLQEQMTFCSAASIHCRAVAAGTTERQHRKGLMLFSRQSRANIGRPVNNHRYFRFVSGGFDEQQPTIGPYIVVGVQIETPAPFQHRPTG